MKKLLLALSLLLSFGAFAVDNYIRVYVTKTEVSFENMMGLGAMFVNGYDSEGNMPIELSLDFINNKHNYKLYDTEGRESLLATNSISYLKAAEVSTQVYYANTLCPLVIAIDRESFEFIDSSLSCVGF